MPNTKLDTNLEVVADGVPPQEGGGMSTGSLQRTGSGQNPEEGNRKEPHCNKRHPLCTHTQLLRKVRK